MKPVVDCLRCRRPVEPPYAPTRATVNGLTLEGPLCEECRAVRGDAFFSEGAWAERHHLDHFTGTEDDVLDMEGES